MKRDLLRYLIVCTFLATVAPAICASQRSQREHGAHLFDSNGCSHCHTIGTTGGSKGPNLSSIGRIATPSAIRKQIVEGGKGMPAFGEVVESKDIDDLVIYLRSCKAKPMK